MPLPTPNKTPGDGAPADDINLIIEAINTLQGEVDNIPAGPQGPQGEPGTPGAAGANASVTVGSTTTGAAGSSAAVTNSGTAQNAILEFTIPQGITGATGATGAQGPIGPTGPQGPIGPPGEAANLSTATPQSLGTASPGSDTEASRSDHVHPLPSAAQVGADPAGSAAAVNSTLSSHTAATTSVHGISNTANLVYTNDSRLTDARTPTAHAASHGAAGGDPITITAAQVTGTAVLDNDARLTNARTPTAHAASHGVSGSDAITVAQSQVTNLTTDLSGKASTTDLSNHTSATTSVHGISNTANLVYTSDSRLTDQRTPLDGSVTTAKIVDANVTNAKLANSSITINGSAVSLGGSVTISGLPDQAGNAGEYLTTDGSTASWAPIVTDPTPTLFLLGGM
jgi:hypothetical protein